MAATVQLLAWSLVLLLVLVQASLCSGPFSNEHHTRPQAAGTALIGEAPLRGGLWTGKALPAISPVSWAAPEGLNLVVFSGAGESDDKLWPDSNHGLSLALSSDSGGSSDLRPPAWPLLLGADDSLQTLEVTPALGLSGTGGSGHSGPAAATSQGHAGLSWGRWPFVPMPGSEGEAAASSWAETLLPASGAVEAGGSPGLLALENREQPSGSAPRNLQPASPTPARSHTAARTPSPSPTVFTIALVTKPGSVVGPGSASAEAWQAKGRGSGRAGRESWLWNLAPGTRQPAPQADVPRELQEYAWRKGLASKAQGSPFSQGGDSTLPPWGYAQGLSSRFTGGDGQTQRIPGASPAAEPGATAKPHQMAGARLAVPSSGGLELGDNAWQFPPALTPVEPASLAPGKLIPTWAVESTLGTRVLAWTEELSAHQRSTRRALPGAVSQAPLVPGKAAPSAQQGPEQLHTSPGAPPASGSPATMPPHQGPAPEEIGPPQQVRGAVDPRTPKNVTSTASSVPGTRHSDAAGIQPHGHGSTMATTNALPRPPASPRRGLIRVTTQRALQRPLLPEPGPSRLPTAPGSSPPCAPASSACSTLPLNQTLLRWADLQRVLGPTWQMHIYGTSALFLLVSLGSTASLIGSPILGLPRLPYTMGANALLLAVGLLRTTFLLTDPYGASARLPAWALLLLYNAPFPLLLSAFALLLLLLLGEAKLQLLPPRLQSLPLLGALASLQSTMLLGADLLLPPLSPSTAVVLHLLCCAGGAALMVATLPAYWQLRQHWAAGVGEAQEASLSCDNACALQGLCTCARVLVGCSILGLLCCGQQAYAALWLWGVLGPPGLFSWSWWGVQFWARICELLLAFGLCFVASRACCQRCSSAEHACWAKLIRYLCTYHKAEGPEYPNNCYNWAHGAPERVASNDISKSLIRNPPEQVHLRALKASNEVQASAVLVPRGSPAALSQPGRSPKCHNGGPMGRSYTSICFEKASVLSLSELEFRPPSPINLSRSIDEALFKEHLVRDSIFLRSSLQCPGRLARQDSCTSLRKSSALTPLAEPLLPAKVRQRRSSDPDYRYSLARCSSLSDLSSQTNKLPHSKGLPSEPPTEGTISGSSLDSFSKGSLKISWNPWRHGLASLESLPQEETPSRAQLLPQEAPVPGTTGEVGDSDREARRSFLVLSKQLDSRSLSSDTIEL